MEDYKTCTKCSETKPLDGFHYHKTRKYYEARCKACAVKNAQKWYKENTATAAKKSRKWYENNLEKAKESRRQSTKKYYWENREQVLQKQHARYDRDKAREYSRKWRAQNPRAGSNYQHRRRARKLANGVLTILEKDLKRLYASPCVACGSTDNITADHVVPVVKGGRHSIGNLQPLCKSCNCSKGDKWMIEWRPA